MAQLILPLDGYCHGPLFAPPAKKRPPRRRPGTKDHGRIRRHAELRAMPGWYDSTPVRQLYREAERLTRESGELWSVAHLVPLQSPWVCGLHWHANMKIQKLDENMKDGNRVWPDMWEVQLELV